MKELGDGLLLWFDDACDALPCVALQSNFERGGDRGPSSMGADGRALGLPTPGGDDIIGHDVNLAARIVEQAGPGEVLCSSAAVQAATGDTGGIDGIRFEELGAVFVRGIDDPVPLMRGVAVPVSA